MSVGAQISSKNPVLGARLGVGFAAQQRPRRPVTNHISMRVRPIVLKRNASAAEALSTTTAISTSTAEHSPKSAIHTSADDQATPIFISQVKPAAADKKTTIGLTQSPPYNAKDQGQRPIFTTHFPVSNAPQIDPMLRSTPVAQPEQQTLASTSAMQGLRLEPQQTVARQTPQIIAPQPFATPSLPKQQRSDVLTRHAVRRPQVEAVYPEDQVFGLSRFAAFKQKFGYSNVQLGLIGMAVIVFVFGIGVSLSTMRTNTNATALAASLSKQIDRGPTTSDASQSQTTSDDPPPSTTQPSSSAFSNYVVAPDLARYIRIPKLGVSARVLQVGIKTDGSLGTPNNVFDTAWYTGSAKPGQEGATLIDGHVSSWTSHGVFYGIKTLVAGDSIQVEKGDGAILYYKVVRTQVYDANHVDMQAAVKPVTPGKRGLNLITCAGQVKPGTNEFNQRVIVFAEQQ